jgi:hypothetical protein
LSAQIATKNGIFFGAASCSVHNLSYFCEKNGIYPNILRNFQQIKVLILKILKNGRKVTENDRNVQKVFKPKMLENFSNNAGERGPFLLCTAHFVRKMVENWQFTV